MEADRGGNVLSFYASTTCVAYTPRLKPISPHVNILECRLRLRVLHDICSITLHQWICVDLTESQCSQCRLQSAERSHDLPRTDWNQLLSRRFESFLPSCGWLRLLRITHLGFVGLVSIACSMQCSLIRPQKPTRPRRLYFDGLVPTASSLCTVSTSFIR